MMQPLQTADGRFPALRQQYEVSVSAQLGPATWWQEAVLGPVELIEFRLDDRHTGQLVARTRVWEMEGFSWRWNLPSVGLYDVEVCEGQRRKGLAKFLLWNLLRYLQDQFFGLVEVHAGGQNEAALKLFQALGFKPVDVGKLFRKQS
jgi:ribosomal protein S18 acetylase RimI-like enzyme